MYLTEQDFFTLDAREFEALCEAHENQERRADLRAGLIASAVERTIPHKSGQRVTRPEEWFGWYRKRVQTVEEMFEVMMSLTDSGKKPN